MWPSRLGHDLYIKAKIKLEVWTGWLAMDDFVNWQVYWHLQLCVVHVHRVCLQ